MQAGQGQRRAPKNVGRAGPSGRMKAALADLHEPPRNRDTTPRTRKWVEEGGEVLLSPQPRSNKDVIDDVSGSGLPRVKRGSQIHYISSVLSPSEGPLSPAHMLPRERGRERGEGQEEKTSGSVETSSAPKRHKRVLASYHAMKQVVDKLDTERTGSITARDLHNAMGKLGIKMRRSEFSRLAGEVDPHSDFQAPGTKHHRLETLEEGPSHRRRVGGEHLPKIGRGARHEKQPQQQQQGKLAWRSVLEKQVSSNWKQLQRAFKHLDPQRSGLIDMHVLLPTLEAHGIVLQTEEADSLYLQLGVGRTGRVNYVEFLKCFAGAALARIGAISAPPDLVVTRDQRARVPSDVESYLRGAALHWRAIR